MATLDPQLVHVLELINQLPATHELSLEGARANFEAAMGLSGKPPEMDSIEDLEVPGPAGPTRVRVFHPSPGGPLPIVVYFHGGGHVIGSLDTHQPLCADLAHRTGSVVVSVDYRLAPEHPFPAAVDDAYAATTWACAHAAELGGTADAVGVAGDSAGGNLAAAVALMARDNGTPGLAMQVLFFAELDHRVYRTGSNRTESSMENAEGYMLEYADMRWFSERYLPDVGEIENPLASPLRASDLSGLPAALVLTAGYDVLRDEGQAYAARLAADGTEVTHQHDADLVHGWSYMSLTVDRCDEAMEQACGWIRDRFALLRSERAEPEVA